MRVLVAFASLNEESTLREDWQAFLDSLSIQCLWFTIKAENLLRKPDFLIAQ